MLKVAARLADGCRMTSDLRSVPPKDAPLAAITSMQRDATRSMSLATELTGVAGEYYVAAQLAHRGWTPALLHAGASHLDLLARGPDGRHLGIQVKATATGSCAMSITRTLPVVAGENDWMVMVDLDASQPDRQADFFIVPLVVAELFAWLGYEAHELWKEQAGKATRVGGTTWLKPRDFAPYRGRWDLLDCDARTVPFEFSGGFDKWLEAVGGVPQSYKPVFRRGTV